MRSTDEQMSEVERRAGLLRTTRRRRRGVTLSALFTVGSLSLIVCLASVLPELGTMTVAEGDARTPVWFGTMISSNPVAGFVVVIVLAFVLGVCATLLAIELMGRKSGRRDEKGSKGKSPDDASGGPAEGGPRDDG